MSESKRIGRNVGRIELLAVMSKVKELLEAGYDRKKIHGRLVAENCLTMSYPTFCYQLKQILSASPVSGSHPIQKPKASGLAAVDKSDQFSIDRHPKLEDLV